MERGLTQREADGGTVAEGLALRWCLFNPAAGYANRYAAPLQREVRRKELQMKTDPLDGVFETPEQSLAHYLNAMPKSLVSVFKREFVRQKTSKQTLLLELADIIKENLAYKKPVGVHYWYLGELLPQWSKALKRIDFSEETLLIADSMDNCFTMFAIADPAICVKATLENMAEWEQEIRKAAEVI